MQRYDLYVSYFVPRSVDCERLRYEVVKVVKKTLRVADGQTRARRFDWRIPVEGEEEVWR